MNLQGTHSSYLHSCPPSALSPALRLRLPPSWLPLPLYLLNSTPQLLSRWLFLGKQDQHSFFSEVPSDIIFEIVQISLQLNWWTRSKDATSKIEEGRKRRALEKEEKKKRERSEEEKREMERLEEEKREMEREREELEKRQREKVEKKKRERLEEEKREMERVEREGAPSENRRTEEGERTEGKGGGQPELRMHVEGHRVRLVLIFLILGLALAAQSFL
jgi:hypothetical protein